MYQGTFKLPFTYRSRFSKGLQLPDQTSLDLFEQLIEAKLGDRQTAKQRQTDGYSCDITKFGHSNCYFQTTKAQKGSVFSIDQDMKTMRQLFDVTRYCYVLFSKSREYTNQIIHHIRPLYEIFLERLILGKCRAYEHYLL